MGEGTDLDRLHDEWMNSVTKDDLEESNRLWLEMVEIIKNGSINEPADDPSEIPEYLIKANGADRAIEVALEGTQKAQQDRNNYALSVVWREVKLILRSKP